MADDPKTPEASAPAKGGGMKAAILPLVNMLLILGVLGLFVYTRIIFKRPVITEQSERVRLAKELAKPTPPPVAGTMSFDTMTVNISSGTSANPDDPQPLGGKLRYVTLGFSVELKDISQKERLEGLRPIIMDQILHVIGRKQPQELTTVQGRYVLKTQLLELINHIASSAKPGDRKAASEALVTQLHFTDFVVQ